MQQIDTKTLSEVIARLNKLSNEDKEHVIAHAAHAYNVGNTGDVLNSYDPDDDGEVNIIIFVEEHFDFIQELSEVFIEVVMYLSNLERDLSRALK